MGRGLCPIQTSLKAALAGCLHIKLLLLFESCAFTFIGPKPLTVAHGGLSGRGRGFIVMELQMPAYYIGEHIVSDFRLFDAYLAKVVPMIERFGGRYLTKAGSHEILEGDWRPNRVVIIEFPDIASIKNWYRAPEYQPLIALRRSAATDVIRCDSEAMSETEILRQAGGRGRAAMLVRRRQSSDLAGYGRARARGSNVRA